MLNGNVWPHDGHGKREGARERTELLLNICCIYVAF